MPQNFEHQTTIPDLTLDETPQLEIPKNIGPYKIESLLNKGGMSLLYLALDPKNKTPVVIKVLSPKYLRNKEVIDRFLKEAKIIAMTDHPNIVKLYDQGKWEKGLYIGMEFIQGVSLRQFILQKSLSQKRALQIILQVAYALCHLHTHGVIHRDLKPENILITETGEVKVIDFGIAQLQTEWGQDRITQRKRLMGTPIYMSPEQKESPLKVSYASDIYSLGIITYELVLGRLSHGVIHLSLLPINLRTIIEKALKIEPQDRYQDIVDFISEISRYLKSFDDNAPQMMEAPVEELTETLAKNFEIFCPNKAPNWPNIEMGISKQQGLFLTPIYFDFFKLSENKHMIVLAEPKKSGLDSIVSISVLRGMIHMLMHQSKEKTPLAIATALDEAINNDPMDSCFSLHLILLDSKNENLLSICYNYNNLYHIPDRSTTPRNIATPNLFLGQMENKTILQTSDNWNAGDQIIFHSKIIDPEKDSIKSYLSEIALFTPQTQTEKILEKRSKQSSRAGFVLSLKRLF